MENPLIHNKFLDVGQKNGIGGIIITILRQDTIGQHTAVGELVGIGSLCSVNVLLTHILSAHCQGLKLMDVTTLSYCDATSSNSLKS
jgi:hypothetical protein